MNTAPGQHLRLKLEQDFGGEINNMGVQNVDNTISNLPHCHRIIYH